MSNHRTPNEIMMVYAKRLRHGEHITAARVYAETTEAEWFDFSMASARVKSENVKMLMNNVWSLQDREIDASFNVCPWSDDRIKFVRDIKNLSPEKLDKYNKRKARLRSLMGKSWVNWNL